MAIVTAWAGPGQLIVTVCVGPGQLIKLSGCPAEAARKWPSATQQRVATSWQSESAFEIALAQPLAAPGPLTFAVRM